MDLIVSPVIYSVKLMANLENFYHLQLPADFEKRNY